MKFDQKLCDFASSFIARTLSGVITNPLQVVRTRVEIIGFNEYKNPMDGLK